MGGVQNFRSAINGFNREDVVRYLEYLTSKHQGQVNQLNAEMESLQRALESRPEEGQAEQVELLSLELESQKSQLQAAEGYRETMERKLQHAESDRLMLEAQLQELAAKLAESEASRQQQEVQLHQLEGACNQLSAKLEAAEAARQSLEVQLTQSEAARKDLTDRCQDLQAAAEAVAVPVPIPMEPVVSAPAAPVSRARELETYRRAQDVERESQIQAQLIYYQANGVLTDAAAKVDGISDEITGLADRVMRELTQLQVAVSGSKHVLQDAATMMRSIRPNV